MTLPPDPAEASHQDKELARALADVFDKAQAAGELTMPAIVRYMRAVVIPAAQEKAKAEAFREEAEEEAAIVQTFNALETTSNLSGNRDGAIRASATATAHRVSMERLHNRYLAAAIPRARAAEASSEGKGGGS